jgi:hypothetical protein
MGHAQQRVSIWNYLTKVYISIQPYYYHLSLYLAIVYAVQKLI